MSNFPRLDETGLNTLLNKIATDVTGQLDDLETTEKSSLVGAINETRYKEWSGTQAQYAAAVAQGLIPDGTIVTITDSPTPTGDLNEHIATFIHSQSGVHGIRYYQDKLEYYDEELEEWVEIEMGGGTTIVQIPSVVIGTYTYNGTEQAPVITGLDTEHTVITGVTASTTPGDFTFTIALKDPTKMVWSDMSITALTYNWSIAKAACPTTVSSDNVTLDADHLTATVTLANVTGEVTVTSSDSTIATAALSGDTITISSVNRASGTATITVAIAESQNYLANSLSITVSAECIAIVSWSTGTDAEIADMLAAYYANEITWEDMGWEVGDTRTIHLNSMKAPNPNSSNTWAAQDIVVVIVAHDHTDLATPINGHTKACITVQTREVLNNNTAVYNDAAGHIHANGDSAADMTFKKWSQLYLRTYMNNIVLGAIPNAFKSIIKPSKHNRLATNGSNPTTANKSDGSTVVRTVETVTDTLFLPSHTELFGNIGWAAYLSGAVPKNEEGTQFKYYETAANRIKYGNNNGASNGNKQQWWIGSASSAYLSTNGYRWCAVNMQGNYTVMHGLDCCGLAPAFAM